jgi:long-chain acyl-CoA synthetase
MYRDRELRYIVQDSQLKGIVTNPSFLASLVQAEIPEQVTFVGVCEDYGEAVSTENLCDIAGGADLANRLVLVSTMVQEGSGMTVELLDPEPNDVAIIAYTSGTTGNPKGAIIGHDNYRSAIEKYIKGLGIRPDDVHYGLAPLFHITGLSLSAGVCLYLGSQLVLSGRFNAETVVKDLSKHQVTTLIGSITAFNAMGRVAHETPDAFDSVRLAYSGGAPIPPSTVEYFESHFGIYVHNIWGMTETSAGGIAVPPNERAPVHPEFGSLSIGQPAPGTEVALVGPDGNSFVEGEVGELVFTSPQVFRGYWAKPEATAAAFVNDWLRTGDGAVIDDEGWVYLVDRLKDQINVSGFKVWPREVEDVLAEHPSTYEAAVIGEPDAYQGERVIAYVSLMPGAIVSEGELSSYVRERLANYKVPKAIFVVDELPKTATGKIQRQVLRLRGS